MFFLHLLIVVFSLLSQSSQSDVQMLAGPVDALSVELPAANATADVRYKTTAGWTAWQTMSVENEQDPALRESNLVMFPANAQTVEVRGSVVALHPIRVSEAPVHYTVAALTDPGTPTILTREEWGADENLRYYSKNPSSASSTAPGEEIPTDSGTGEPSQRVEDCNTAQLNYPSEFKTNGRLVKDENGHMLLWPRTYSKEVKLLVVHHTAMQVEGDARSGAERVRALYAYHAVNRGWGDVGYHYLIDEDGQIYEGKAGGKYVIGGHAYCNNINTMGIALLGNFDIEQPTQKQLKALQWLIDDLSKEYDIDLTKNVEFHGKTLPPVIGHRDLLSTDCPGFFVYGALTQILAHAADGDLTADVRLPNRPKTIAGAGVSSRKAARVVVAGRSNPSEGTARRVARAGRLLLTDASLALQRKLGSNPGKETEAGVAARRTARLSGSSVSRSSRSSTSRSSISSKSSKSSTSSLSSIASAKENKSSKSSIASIASNTIRIRLTSVDASLKSCDAVNIGVLQTLYRGTVSCALIDGKPAVINTLSLEEYLMGLGEEPDTEPYEKQRAFAIAARTYAAYYMDADHRKFPGMPYDGSDSPATFQKYVGKTFEGKNPSWLKAVASTSDQVLTVNGELIKPPYFSSDDGRTRTPKEAGWSNFPFASIFTSKADPWCEGMELRGHGVGMSGCGAEGQANEGKSGEEILKYYYPGTTLTTL